MKQFSTDFKKRLDDLTDGFIGREWLIDEVDVFITQHRFSR